MYLTRKHRTCASVCLSLLLAALLYYILSHFASLSPFSLYSLRSTWLAAYERTIAEHEELARECAGEDRLTVTNADQEPTQQPINAWLARAVLGAALMSSFMLARNR